MNKNIEEADKFASLLGTSFKAALEEMECAGYGFYIDNLRAERTIRLCDVYFAMVALHHPHVKKILEIGTGSGRATILLSKLFPEANVWTFDIPEDDPSFGRLGKKEGNREEIRDRMQLIENIVYFEKNSFFLSAMTFLPNYFDLIFIDGGHEYPSVAWDLAYGYGHLNRKGFMFIHDYGNRGNVQAAVDYMVQRIPHKIFFLPSTSAEKLKSKTVCVWSG